jgi:2-octaprenyl-6-methoxyphenol hydroxylase
LPLKRDAVIGHRSSIVWTEQAQEAARIVALPDADFHAELEQRFGLHLGEIEAVGPRRVLPLGLWVARTFIAHRLALVGDAAHVIHPIAGQGLNMGLKDVAALAEVIVDAARLGLDPGSLAVLERYQRWRRFDTVAMGVATDGLNRLFSNRSDVLRLGARCRDRVVDRLPALKRFFIREAAGLGRRRPEAAARRGAVAPRSPEARTPVSDYTNGIASTCSLNAGRCSMAVNQRSKLSSPGRSGTRRRKR